MGSHPTPGSWDYLSTHRVFTPPLISQCQAGKGAPSLLGVKEEVGRSHGYQGPCDCVIILMSSPSCPCQLHCLQSPPPIQSHSCSAKTAVVLGWSGVILLKIRETGPGWVCSAHGNSKKPPRVPQRVQGVRRPGDQSCHHPFVMRWYLPGLTQGSQLSRVLLSSQAGWEAESGGH